MIDEDKIEKAAKEYAEKNKTLIKNTTSIFDIIFGNSDEGFKEGINWFLINLWHHAKQKPKEDKILLIQHETVGMKDPGYITLNPDKITNWRDTVADFHILRWCYINDLLINKTL